jgi:hypothetical protein
MIDYVGLEQAVVPLNLSEAGQGKRDQSSDYRDRRQEFPFDTEADDKILVLNSVERNPPKVGSGWRERRSTRPPRTVLHGPTGSVAALPFRAAIESLARVNGRELSTLSAQ